ncbi:hypothetical protein ACFPRL_34925 [Pseudoclavibacter helvolus]
MQALVSGYDLLSLWRTSGEAVTLGVGALRAPSRTIHADSARLRRSGWRGGAAPRARWCARTRCQRRFGARRPRR